MNSGNDQLRTELNRIFQPPIDVMLDPSLLVASRTLSRLADSSIFSSQTQATLGRTPTEPRLGDLHVPATFREIISESESSTVRKLDMWDFYRGKAESAFAEDIIDLLDTNDVESFTTDMVETDLHWNDTIPDSGRKSRLLEVLEEEISFLHSGGLLLLRTPTTLKTLRDAGVPTVDIGEAALAPELSETLGEIGYESPVGICAFGITNTESTIDALVGSLVEDSGDMLLYQIGD